jgi:inorganic pyrophosphatase
LLAGPLAATRLISVMRDLADLPHSPGEGILHVVVESPAGATSKIKWDPELGVFALSRPLPLGVAYPHDWGFVPGTRAADGDSFDALVLSQGSSYPGVLLRSRPIGIVELEQNRKKGGGRERNDRVVAVPANAPRLDVHDVARLPERVRVELEQFFRVVTVLEGKDAVILGWKGPEVAWRAIEASLRRR